MFKKIVSVFLACLFCFTFFSGCDKKDKEWEKAVAEYRQNKMTAYQKENEETLDYEVDIAFLGDSLTDMYDVKKYYPNYVVSNRGIGGDTTYGLENRLQVSLYDLKPKVATLLIGANNMEKMFENYERIIVSIKENAPNTKLVILSLTAMGGKTWGQLKELAAYNNVKIKMLAEKYNLPYVDLYSSLINYETMEIYEEYTTDGGHLTPKGYEVLTSEITPVVEEQLSLWHQEN